MNGLKQHIVIVNEFTTKTSKGGSRGGTPGGYVERYMAREKATEILAPIRHDDVDSFVTRYMARDSAVDDTTSVPSLKRKMRNKQGQGGVAFGYGDVSLSHKKLKAASKDIQRCFDNGKTVMKTVISFDEEYLREHGLVSDDFQFENRGDYRGHIDQMKLRMAIMHGIKGLSRFYDDLQYVGVIQVDTAHVHCHLAMVDRGDGKYKVKGVQRGKINETGKRAIRRGIDLYLDEQKSLHMMAASVGYDRQNVISFVKRFAHKLMAEHGTPQFLLSCLPSDKRLWRASTNRKDMKKPNTIVRELVMEILSADGSGYDIVQRNIDEYVRNRVNSENLTNKDYRVLAKQANAQFINDCMNAVYSVLAQINENEKRVWTPMLSAMSMSYEEMAAQTDDPMVEFGFRLRSYSSRLGYHKKETKKYHELVREYENTPNVSEDSKPLYEFFKFEEEYNAQLMAKYQHFLSFLPPDEDYEEGFRQLMEYRKRIRNMEMMISDKSMPRMLSDRAEAYGRKVYDMHGGEYTVTAPHVLDIRLDAMRDRYKTMEDDFIYRLSLSGYSLDEKGVKKVLPYDFDDVKALDIHHLGFDWSYDTIVADENVEKFVATANRRYMLYEAAKSYLQRSGQSESILSLPEKDIYYMKELADSMSVQPVLHTSVGEAGEKRRNKTVSLDDDYMTEIRSAIHDVVIRETGI